MSSAWASCRFKSFIRSDPLGLLDVIKGSVQMKLPARVGFYIGCFPSRSADVDLQLHDSPPLTADVNTQHIWANLRRPTRTSAANTRRKPSVWENTGQTFSSYYSENNCCRNDTHSEVGTNLTNIYIEMYESLFVPQDATFF